MPEGPEGVYQGSIILFVLQIGLGLLDLLLEARKCGEGVRPDLLRRADIELDRLRYTVRLCHEIDLFSLKQYRHASSLLAEVGRLLGTWRKRYTTE